jgi:hypothetical protein
MMRVSVMSARHLFAPSGVDEDGRTGVAQPLSVDASHDGVDGGY